MNKTYYLAITGDITDRLDDPLVKAWTNDEYVMAQFVSQSKKWYGARFVVVTIEADTFEEMVEEYIDKYFYGEGIPFDIFDDTKLYSVSSWDSKQIMFMTKNEILNTQKELLTLSKTEILQLHQALYTMIVNMLQFFNTEYHADMIELSRIFVKNAERIFEGLKTSNVSRLVDPVYLRLYKLEYFSDDVLPFN